MNKVQFTPRYLRLALHEAINAWRHWPAGEPEPWIDVRGQPLPISAIAERLLGTEGILPRKWCLPELGLSPRASYAEAADALYHACGARNRAT